MTPKQLTQIATAAAEGGGEAGAFRALHESANDAVEATTRNAWDEFYEILDECGLTLDQRVRLDVTAGQIQAATSAAAFACGLSVPAMVIRGLFPNAA
jgi:hypothetical protein